MSKQDKKELRQQIACEWLQENYLNYGSLRHDVVTDRLQIRVADLHSLEDGSAYSLRAPHNATSVIGDPAEFRGDENSVAETPRLYTLHLTLYTLHCASGAIPLTLNTKP